MNAHDRDVIHTLACDDAAGEQIINYIEAIMERKEDEKRYLTDRLLRAENLVRIKSDLLSVLNLEARTPLTTVIILCDVLRRHRERLSNQRYDEVLDQIQAQVERLGELLNQLGGMAPSGD